MISIIVPVYNGEKYLKACLSSLINQTSKSFEVILIDDGSTDSSGAVCDDYASKYDCIKVIHCENGGVSRARNRGLSEINGSHYMFVDSDDQLETDALEKCQAVVKEKDPDVIVFGIKYHYLDLSVYESKPQKISVFEHSETHETIKELYRSGLIGSPVNKIYKADFSDECFDMDVNYAEDWRYNYRVFRNVESIVALDECLYNCYKHEESLSSSFRFEKIDQLVDFFYESKKFLREIADNISAEVLLERHFYEYLFPYLLRELTLSKYIVNKKKKEYIEIILRMPSYHDYLKSGKAKGIYNKILCTKNIILIKMYIRILEVIKNARGNA